MYISDHAQVKCPDCRRAYTVGELREKECLVIPQPHKGRGFTKAPAAPAVQEEHEELPDDGADMEIDEEEEDHDPDEE